MTEEPRAFRQLHRRTMALVLAGGRGTRLKALTQTRAKPAVHFGGKYRIIDFALSNCINSGIRRMAVLTQYKAHSLLRHLQKGWNWLRPEVNEFVEFWPAQQRVEDNSWYKGTADAIYQNADILRGYGPDYLLVLAGDHIYKMDYSVMLEEHVRTGADVTVGCVEVDRATASAFGVMDIDASDRVRGFLEKPKDPPEMPDKPGRTLASMGIYVFNAEFLYNILERDAIDPYSSHDFGKDIIPYLVQYGTVYAHRFEKSCVRSHPTAEPYWRDVGTVDSYWQANIDLADITPALNLYDTQWPIWSHQEQLPPAKFVHDSEGRRGMALDSLVSAGCIVSGGTVRMSTLFNRVRVNSYAELDRAVLLPDVDVGRSARLNRVVVDRGVQIPAGLVVGENPDKDAKRFYRTESGVVLITRKMIQALER